MTEKTISAFSKKHQLTEEQAQSLIQNEKNGPARKCVLKMLADQALKAKQWHNLKEALDKGIALPTVPICRSKFDFLLLLATTLLLSLYIFLLLSQQIIFVWSHIALSSTCMCNVLLFSLLQNLPSKPTIMRT